MEGNRFRVEDNARESAVLEGLRKWQKRSLKTRCLLKTLAKNLSTTKAKLESILRRGSLRSGMRKKAAKKSVLVEGFQFAAKKRTVSSIHNTLQIEAFTAVTSRRILRPLRGLRQARKSRIRKALKALPMAEASISQTSLASLNRSHWNR